MQECNCASQQTEDVLCTAAAPIFKNHVKTLQLSYLHFLEKKLCSNLPPLFLEHPYFIAFSYKTW